MTEEPASLAGPQGLEDAAVDQTDARNAPVLRCGRLPDSRRTTADSPPDVISSAWRQETSDTPSLTAGPLHPTVHRPSVAITLTQWISRRAPVDQGPRQCCTGCQRTWRISTRKTQPAGA